MELAGDVPRPVGPHRAALSLVTDRKTKGQLWACPLFSVPGRRFSRQSSGSLCGSHSLFWWGDLKLSVFVGEPLLALSVSSSHIGQEVHKSIEMMLKRG